MDTETRARLGLVGRLITELSPGSIKDLHLKTRAISILRDVVDPVREPIYPKVVYEVAGRIKDGHETVDDLLNSLAYLYEVGMQEGQYQSGISTQEAEPDADSIVDAKGLNVGLDAALQRLHSTAAQIATAAQRPRKWEDDADFFRKGGI